MIRVEGVSRRFGATVAVDEVSFEVEKECVVGILGPNGAGKSTLFRMLATYLPPSAGRLSVLGLDVARQGLEVRRRIGYLPEHNPLYDTMRAGRFLEFVARVHSLEGAGLRAGIEAAVEGCGIGPVLGKRVRECSKGFRQRLGVAAALVHDPPVLILDEPTHGLDPLQVLRFLEFVRTLARKRVVLFSSHVVSEVAAISERLLVLHEGRLLEDSPLEVFRERARAAGTSVEASILEVFGPGAVPAAARPEEPASGR